MALAGVDTASLGAYSEKNARDPELIRLREMVVLDFREGWPSTLAEIEIALGDGKRVSVRHDAGIPATDIAEQGERLAAKFETLAAPVLGAPRTRELRQMVAGLDGLGEIGSLARLAAG